MKGYYGKGLAHPPWDYAYGKGMAAPARPAPYAAPAYGKAAGKGKPQMLKQQSRPKAPMQSPKAPAKAASPASGSKALVDKAEKRLAANHTDERMAEISRLREELNFGDEVELALRMLSLEMFQEFLVGEEDLKLQVAEAVEEADKTYAVLSVVAALDPEVETLVQGLMAMDQDGDAGQQAEGSTSSTAAPGSDEEVVAEAQKRLQVKKSPADTAAIQRLKRDFKLGDEVELALRMLSADKLRELLAGEGDIRRKMGQEKEPARKGELVMWLVSQLDSEVQALVEMLMKMDQGKKQPEQEAPSSWKVVFHGGVKVRKVPEADGEILAVKKQGNKVKGVLEGEWIKLSDEPGYMLTQMKGRTLLQQEAAAPAPSPAKAPSAVSGSAPDSATAAEAAKRLRTYTTPMRKSMLLRLKTKFGFGDEVELALRLLAADKFRELTRKETELEMQLSGAEDDDKTQIFLAEVYSLGPEVEELCMSLLQQHGEAAAALASVGSPPQAAKAGLSAGKAPTVPKVKPFVAPAAGKAPTNPKVAAARPPKAAGGFMSASARLAAAKAAAERNAGGSDGAASAQTAKSPATPTPQQPKGAQPGALARPRGSAAAGGSGARPVGAAADRSRTPAARPGAAAAGPTSAGFTRPGLKGQLPKGGAAAGPAYGGGGPACYGPSQGYGKGPAAPPYYGPGKGGPKGPYMTQGAPYGKGKW